VSDRSFLHEAGWADPSTAGYARQAGAQPEGAAGCVSPRPQHFSWRSLVSATRPQAGPPDLLS
jgi:hypothetical protein